MYNILIVDDERIERNGIKKLLGKVSYDISVSECENGRDALEYLEGHKVDVMITDVKMPFVDGIELIRQAAPLYPDMKMIIFSGYSEFEYARFAMKMGVTDYILKPVDPAEFDRTITNVIVSLDERNKQRVNEQDAKDYLEQHLLYEYVYGSLDPAEGERLAGLLGREVSGVYRFLMLLETNEEFFGRMGLEFGEKLRTFISVPFRYLNLNPQQSVLFFEKGDTEGLAGIAERILEKVQNDYGCKMFAAVSEEGEGKESDIAEQFKFLEELMEERFYETDRRVYVKYDSEDEKVLVKIDDDTLMKQMKQDIHMKDIENLRAHFKKLSEKYRGEKCFSQIYVKFIFSNLLKDFYSNLPKVSELELNKEIDRLYCAKDYDTVMEIVNINIDRLEEAFGINPQTVHREIETVKNYIFENYNKEISITELAEKVYMAPSYLSYVFKSETGQNLSKFIKAYRMEKAKEMLTETHNKIVNIANAVGYENVSYFCQSFREYYGVSPQKFRDQGETYD